MGDHPVLAFVAVFMLGVSVLLIAIGVWARRIQHGPSSVQQIASMAAAGDDIGAVRIALHHLCVTPYPRNDRALQHARFVVSRDLELVGLIGDCISRLGASFTEATDGLRYALDDLNAQLRPPRCSSASAVLSERERWLRTWMRVMSARKELLALMEAAGTKH